MSFAACSLRRFGTEFESNQSYNSLLQTMDQIHAGQVVGALHCSAVLRNCCDLVANVSELEQYVVARGVVDDQFDRKLRDVIARSDNSNVVAFQSKYKSVIDAATSWEFGEDLTWLSSTTEDKARNADVKSMEAFVVLGSRRPRGRLASFKAVLTR